MEFMKDPSNHILFNAHQLATHFSDNLKPIWLKMQRETGQSVLAITSSKPIHNGKKAGGKGKNIKKTCPSCKRSGHNSDECYYNKHGPSYRYCTLCKAAGHNLKNCRKAKRATKDAKGKGKQKADPPVKEDNDEDNPFQLAMLDVTTSSPGGSSS